MNNPKTTFKKETKLQKINNLNNKIKKKKEVKGGNGGFFTDLASFFKINENKTRSFFNPIKKCMKMEFVK